MIQLGKGKTACEGPGVGSGIYWALEGLGGEQRGLRNLESRSSGTRAAEGEAEKGVESTSDPGDGRREGPEIYWGAGGRRKCRWRKEGPYEPGP